MYADIADGCHDDCGNQNAGQNGTHGLFEAQVQEACADWMSPRLRMANAGSTVS